MQGIIYEDGNSNLARAREVCPDWAMRRWCRSSSGVGSRVADSARTRNTQKTLSVWKE